MSTIEIASTLHQPLHIYVPISAGELYDKLTILEIKISHGINRAQDEFNALFQLAQQEFIQTNRLYMELKEINSILWDTENRIRGKEALEKFDAEFISLARSVYYTNDARAHLKQCINKHFHSALEEVKCYTPYR